MANFIAKEELIKTIQEFVGKDGYVAFEHGFRPNFNAYGVAYDYTDCHGGYKTYFKDMTETQLTIIIIDLMRYMNYCHLYA